MEINPTKESSSPKVRGMYNRTQGDMSAASLVTWGVTLIDISSLACFTYGDFYFQFQLTVLFLTGHLVIAFSSCEHMEL